jgi:hypothetical protein
MLSTSHILAWRYIFCEGSQRVIDKRYKIGGKRWDFEKRLVRIWGPGADNERCGAGTSGIMRPHETSEHSNERR